MRRFLFALALGILAAGPATAQQPGEIVLTPHTLAEEYQLLQSQDAFMRNGVIRTYKESFGIDLENTQDRARMGKEFALYRGFKDSFGAYHLNILTQCRMSARPGAAAGGSVIGFTKRARVTLDPAGRRDSLLSEEGTVVYLFVTDANGLAREPNKNRLELQLDPKRSQSLSWTCTAQVGYGLYDNKPATGKRDDAKITLADRADVFIGVPADEFAKKVRWLGPVKQFTFHITLDAQGNWTWRDDSMGIDLKGKIAD